MCTSQTVTGKSVNIHHSSLHSPYRYDQCSCMVTPANCTATTRLEFRAIDVRLHSISDDDTIDNCSIGSRLEIVGQRDLKRYDCQRNRFMHGYELFHVSSEKNLALYLHKKYRQFPQTMWMEVKGILSVVCNLFAVVSAFFVLFKINRKH